MKPPVQKLVICHDCSYEWWTREPLLNRNYMKRPLFCGTCGSRFLEVKAEHFEMVICQRAEQIDEALEALGGRKPVPNVFQEAFKGMAE